MPAETIEEPSSQYDAVFGRGGSHNRLRANTFFRKAILRHWVTYCDLPNETRVKRAFVEKKFIEPITKNGGRFLYRTGRGETGKWKELNPYDFLDYKEINRKICQSLRDMKKESIRKANAAALTKCKPKTMASKSESRPSRSTRSRATTSVATTGVSNTNLEASHTTTDETPTTVAVVSPPVSPPDSRRSSFRQHTKGKSRRKKRTTNDSVGDEQKESTVDTLVTLEEARGILEEFELEEDFPSADSSFLEDIDSDTIPDFFLPPDMEQKMCELLSIENTVLDIAATAVNIISDDDNVYTDNRYEQGISFVGHNSSINGKHYIQDFSFYEVVAEV